MDYPQLGHLEFGSVEVGKRKFETDVYLLADGSVEKRKKKRVKSKHGTSHVIDAEELKLLMKSAPQTLIIGTGMYGAARVSEDGAEYLRQTGINWQALPSAEALKAFQQAKGRRAMLLHLTC